MGVELAPFFHLAFSVISVTVCSVTALPHIWTLVNVQVLLELTVLVGGPVTPSLRVLLPLQLFVQQWE